MLSPDYVAGLFDGEGMISIIYTKIRPWLSDPERHTLAFRMVVGVANTHLGVLRLLQAQFSGDITVNARPSKKHKPIGYWKVTSTVPQRRFLETIQPAVVIKSERVVLGLRYLATKVHQGGRLTTAQWNERLAIFSELRKLNRRGPAIANVDVSDAPFNHSDVRRYSDLELFEMIERGRRMARA